MGRRERGTIAVAFVQEALYEMRRLGLDVVQVLRDAEISPSVLTAAQARVSAERYGVLWHSIATALDDEFFGMDSRAMKRGSFTLLCHCVLHASTLEQGLSRALRFLGLVLDDFHGSLERHEGHARIVVHDVNRHGQESLAPRRAFAYGTYLLIVHGLACWLVGRRIPLTSAEFRCARPDFSAEWKVLFTSALSFEQPQTSIYFANHYLDMRPIQTETSMRTFLRAAPANFLVKYKNSAGLTANIRRRLRSSDPSTWSDLDGLAKELNCSISTLRRRLDDEGQSYRAIQDDLRMDIAISLLSDSEKSVADIALEIGFMEPSAFHRAFKKWTGVRPGEYRSNMNSASSQVRADASRPALHGRSPSSETKTG